MEENKYDFTLKFGYEKGKTPEILIKQNNGVSQILWYRNVFWNALNDPQKARWKESNMAFFIECERVLYNHLVEKYIENIDSNLNRLKKKEKVDNDTDLRKVFAVVTKAKLGLSYDDIFKKKNLKNIKKANTFLIEILKKKRYRHVSVFNEEIKFYLI